MRTELLHEFYVFSKYLNIQRTASELFISQSNLRKHFEKMEEELGFSLIDHRDGMYALTPAGVQFLSDIIPLLTAYDGIVEKCRELSLVEELSIKVKGTTYVDKVAQSYSRLLNRIRANTSIKMRFAPTSYQDEIEALVSDKYQIIFLYEYGCYDDIVSRYESNGLAWTCLGEDTWSVFCRKGHDLDKGCLTIEELDGVPLLAPTDCTSPLHRLYEKICTSHGFNPTMRLVETLSSAEFLHVGITSEVLLYPSSYGNGFLVETNDNIVEVPFVDDAVTVYAFSLISPRSLDENERAALEPFFASPSFEEYLQNRE